MRSFSFPRMRGKTNKKQKGKEPYTVFDGLLDML